MAQLRKRGLGTVVICSDSFLNLGKAQARVLGVPDIALAVITHPLGGLTLEQVEGRARMAIPQVTELIKERMQ